MSTRGALFALLAAVLFGATTPLSKILLADAPPVALAGLLYLSSGVGLGAFWVARRLAGHRTEASLRRADLPWLAGAVVSGGIVAPVLLLSGLQHATASTASLLLNLEGLATMAIAWIVVRESVDSRLLAGAAAILAGSVVLGWQGGGIRIDASALAIAGACVAWGIDNNLTRKLSATDPTEVAAIKGLAAGTVNCALAAATGATLPAAPVLGAGFAVGLLGYGISLVLFIRALRNVGAARTSAYFSTAPFLGAAASIALLHEPVTLHLVVAGGLMALGVYLHLSERHSHEHRHEALAHAHAHVHDLHHRHAHDPGDPVGEPHVHVHAHEPMTHAHPHYPDIHHGHRH